MIIIIIMLIKWIFNVDNNIVCAGPSYIISISVIWNLFWIYSQSILLDSGDICPTSTDVWFIVKGHTESTKVKFKCHDGRESRSSRPEGAIATPKYRNRTDDLAPQPEEKQNKNRTRVMTEVVEDSEERHM